MMTILGSIPIGNIRGLGPLGLEKVGGVSEELLHYLSVDRFSKIISVTIGIMTIVAAIWFIFKLLAGGIAIISSGGDKGKLAQAKDNITYGAVGLVIVISAIFILSLIGTLFDIDFLNFTALLKRLEPEP